MKFTLLASLSVFITATQSVIVAPVDGFVAKPETSFPFQLGPEILSSNIFIDHVDVGLEVVPVGAVPKVIDLATLTATTGFTTSITLPASAITGTYYLIAIPHYKSSAVLNKAAASWKIYNQTFYVDCPGPLYCM